MALRADLEDKVIEVARDLRCVGLPITLATLKEGRCPWNGNSRRDWSRSMFELPADGPGESVAAPELAAIKISPS
jgi:hypothetical protein